MNNKFFVYQNNKALNKYIQETGCYFLCLHYYISLFKDEFFCAHNINDNYNSFVKKKYILKNCFIMQPTLILYWYEIKTKIKKESILYQCKDNEFEITRVQIKDVAGGHFLVTKDNQVVYDPLRLDDRKISYTSVSKRIFTF